MAKDWAKDIGGYLAKNKVKAARKTLDKAAKAGAPDIRELELSVLLAEGDEAAAAGNLESAASLKIGDQYLRKNPAAATFRDSFWEAALAGEEFDLAVRHLGSLLGGGGFDGGARAKSLLGRKDAVGATRAPVGARGSQYHANGIGRSRQGAGSGHTRFSPGEPAGQVR